MLLLTYTVLQMRGRLRDSLSCDGPAAAVGRVMRRGLSLFRPRDGVGADLDLASKGTGACQHHIRPQPTPSSVLDHRTLTVNNNNNNMLLTIPNFYNLIGEIV